MQRSTGYLAVKQREREKEICVQLCREEEEEEEEEEDPAPPTQK